MKRSMHKKQAVQFVSAVIIGMFLCTFVGLPALAYYNQGTVSLLLGNTSITVAQGGSCSTSAIMSPASANETLGCGMPQCPQGCGSGCQDAAGQCTCAGTQYSNYPATVVLTSANSSIATAKYTSGIISITGVSPGTTTIYAQGSLREYTSSAMQAIRVTVTAAGNLNGGSTGSPSGGRSGGSTTGTTGGSVGMNSSAAAANTAPGGSGKTGGSVGASAGSASGKVSGSSAANSGGASSPAAAESSPSASSAPASSSAVSGTCPNSADGGLGSFDIMQLPENNIAGKVELEKIMGTDKSATFQKKDAAGNVQYSWSFKGTDIKDPADINMGISFSSKEKAAIEKQSGLRDLLDLSFAYHGELPGKAELNVCVSSLFRDGQMLYFYYYDPSKHAFSLISKGVKAVNGYATVDITHCSTYFFSARAVGSSSGFPVWLAVLLTVLAVVAVGAPALYVYILRGGALPDPVVRLLRRPMETPPASTAVAEEPEHEKERLF